MYNFTTFRSNTNAIKPQLSFKSFATKWIIASLFLFGINNSSSAQVNLAIHQGVNVSSINTGDQFIDTINYACSSFTSNGQNVVANLALPQNLVPYVISPFANSVAYDETQVSSVTYSSATNTIQVVFVNPLPAGSTGQIQIKFKYLPGSTPNGYNPNIIASINGDNFKDGLGNSLGPVFDTTNVVAVAANNFSIGKSVKAGGAINDITIYKLNISANSTIGSLDLTNPILIDTLPVGAVFQKATIFSGSNPPVYDATHNTVTWTWPSGTVFSGYGSSAYVSVKYSNPTFNEGDDVCNNAYLTGSIPVLPIGTYASDTKSGSYCFGLSAPTAGANCNGGRITAATAWWLDHHILAGTNCNWFSNGWFNGGNTELEEVNVTYSIDKSIDMNTIRIKPVYDGFDSAAAASIFVEYKTNLNASFTTLGTYQSLDIANGITGSDFTPTLASGEYLTQVHFKISGTLPIGGYQDLSYCGNSRTAITGAKDGSAIKEGTYHPASAIGDDGTVVHNTSVGSYVYGGVVTNYNTCSDSAEIIYAQPAFHDTYKSILNSDNNFKASDTVNYQFHTYLGGNDNATTVVVSDTLDTKLTYVNGSSTYTIGGGAAVSITPVVTTSVAGKTILTYNLGTLTSGKDYYVAFNAVIKPGTLPQTIPNKMTLSSNNALFNTETDPVNLNIISAVALRAFKGQSGCDPGIVYYPVNAVAQEGGPVNYKITLKNLGNVAAKDLVLVDVFPFVADYRSSQWYANLTGPVTISDPSAKIYYTTVNNPCYVDFSPASNPSGCNSNPNWSLTPPVDITTVRGIKITRSATLNVLDSLILSWPMRAPVGVPQGLLMNNSIMYQVSRADNGSQLLPAVPNKVGMYTNCTPVLGSIGNYAWLDTNKNGLQDEPASLGLNGVKVYLYGAGNDGQIGGGDDVLLDSNVTANDWNGNPGYYKFVEVPSGKYYLQFPKNYNANKLSPVTIQTDKTDGNNDVDSTTGLSELVTINASGTGQDKDNTTIDAGFYPTGSLGNYVWYDVDGDGQQNDGASNGINGIKVYLYKDNGAGTYELKDSTVTTNNASNNPGYYNFYLDESGNYKVLFPTSVSTKVITSQTTAAKTDGNSDADVSTGFSPVIVMNLVSTGRNKNNPTIDAGYKCNVPTPVVTGSLQLCNGFATTLSATGNPVYQWYKDGVAISGATNQTYTTTLAGASPTPAGSYTVTSTDIGGCTSAPSSPAVVTIPAPPAKPVITPNGATTFCSGNSLQLTSSAGTTYQWYKDGSILSGETNSTTTVTTSGDYTVVVSNNLGCLSVASDAVTITVNVTPAPAAPSLVTAAQYCVGQVVLTSSPAAGYQWYLNGVAVPGATSQVYNAEATGDYTVVLTGATGCISAPSASTYAFVNVTAIPVISTYGSPQICGGNSVQLNSSSGYSTYQWYKDGVAISGADNLSYTTTTPGSYTVVGTIGTGCPSKPSAPLVVSIVGSAPTPIITKSTTGCIGGSGSVMLTSSSAASYQWTFQSIGSSHAFPISGATNQTYNATQPGIYAVYISNGFCNALSASDTLNNFVVAAFNTTATTVANTPCLDNNSISFVNTSTGATAYTWSIDGIVESNAFNAPDTTFTTANTYNVKLVATNALGCKDSITKQVYVYSCSVSSGSGGGVESKSLGSIIGTRNYRLYKKGANGPVFYPQYELIKKPTRNSPILMGGGAAGSLASIMPYQVDAAYDQYDKTSAVTDLETFTNAIDVRAVDFTKNKVTKAVAFATKTLGGVYSHTKPICDRLRGAELLKVENVLIQGLTFVRYTLKQEDGSLEYAISFSAGTKSGRNNFSIQSNWMTKDYIGEDTLVNYQLWAANPSNVETMVVEVLSRLQNIMPVQQINKNGLPNAYVESGNRKATNLSLTIQNNTSNTAGYFELTERKYEDGSTAVRTVPFTITANAKSTVELPVGDSYEADVKMFLNNGLEDLVYMADGIWGKSFNQATTTVNQFSVSNDDNRQYSSDEYPLLRNVTIQATSPDYVSVYKFLRGGGAAQNLSEYKSFKFTANTNSASNIRVTITKKSIAGWDKQYTYLVSNVEDGKTYQIGLSEFVSADSSLSKTMDASDITSVVFSIEISSGQSTNFTTALRDLSFTKEDVVYTRTLEVKSVNIAPNPNKGVFKVSFVSPNDKPLKLKVLDLSGRIVASKFITAIRGNNQVSVELTNGLKNGYYVVALEGFDTKYEPQKLMINAK